MEYCIKWERSLLQPEFGDAQETILHSPTGTTWLWSSGIIANRAELILQMGLPSNISNEVLLSVMYEHFGVATAEKIFGQCAWIIWDARQHMLVAARDRLGTQGLYYTVHGDTFWLASDMGSLLEQVPGRHRFNLSAVVGQIQAEAPPEGDTFYEGIASVAPGNCLIVSSCKVKRIPYWQVKPRPTLKLASDLEYSKAYRSLLYEVVRGYVTDEPLGITLSSGMDSTSIAAAIKAVAPDANLSAVTYTTPELPQAEEYHLAQLVARRLNIPQFPVRGDLYWTLSAPEGLRTERANPFRLYYEEKWDALFAEFTRYGIHIVFLGVGGDELFGLNVFDYPDLLLTGHWIRLVREFRDHMARMTIRRTVAQAVRNMVIEPIIQAYLPFAKRRRISHHPWLLAEHLPLLQDTFAPILAVKWMLPGRAQRFESLFDLTRTNVTEHLQRQAFQRHGIELRRPLNDHRLVEFAASLPTDQTFRGGQRKIIMRNAMRGILPDEIVNMWGKIVPTAIAERGLRDREQNKVWELLTAMRAAELGLVDEACLRQFYRDYVDGKHQNALFWYTLTLEDWLRRYF